MKTSEKGIYALALHEGIVPGPYKDSVGVWTYGIGHTAAAGHPDPAKMARGMPDDIYEALERVFQTFRLDLPKYEAGVNRAVKVPVTQEQFDALVSFHYNTGAIAKASLVKRLNAGDVDGAAAGFMAWKKPPEIIERRKQEQSLFAKGIYPTGQVTVWRVDVAGRVIWKPAMRLNMAKVLELMRGRPATMDLASSAVRRETSVTDAGPGASANPTAAAPPSNLQKTQIAPPHTPPKPGLSGPVALILGAGAVVATAVYNWGAAAGQWLAGLFN
ncbi:MAG: lysozyme [Paracoccaceae bacterium]